MKAQMASRQKCLKKLEHMRTQMQGNVEVKHKHSSLVYIATEIQLIL